MKRFLRIFADRDSGQDLVEYSLLVSFLTLASAGLMMGAGVNVSQVWSTANSVLTQASPAAPAHHHHGEGD